MDGEELSRAARDFLHELESIEVNNSRFYNRHFNKDLCSPLTGSVVGQRIEQYRQGDNHPYASQSRVKTTKEIANSDGLGIKYVRRYDAPVTLQGRNTKSSPSAGGRAENLHSRYKPAVTDHSASPLAVETESSPSSRGGWPLTDPKNLSSGRSGGQIASPCLDADLSSDNTTSSAYSSFSSGGVESSSTITSSRNNGSCSSGPARPTDLPAAVSKNSSMHKDNTRRAESAMGSSNLHRAVLSDCTFRSFSERPQERSSATPLRDSRSRHDASVDNSLSNVHFQDIFDRFERDFAELSTRTGMSPNPETETILSPNGVSRPETRRPSSRSRIVDRDRSGDHDDSSIDKSHHKGVDGSLNDGGDASGERSGQRSKFGSEANLRNGWTDDLSRNPLRRQASDMDYRPKMQNEDSVSERGGLLPDRRRWSAERNFSSLNSSYSDASHYSEPIRSRKKIVDRLPPPKTPPADANLSRWYNERFDPNRSQWRSNSVDNDSYRPMPSSAYYNGIHHNPRTPGMTPSAYNNPVKSILANPPTAPSNATSPAHSNMITGNNHSNFIRGYSIDSAPRPSYQPSHMPFNVNANVLGNPQLSSSSRPSITGDGCGAISQYRNYGLSNMLPVSNTVSGLSSQVGSSTATMPPIARVPSPTPTNHDPNPSRGLIILPQGRTTPVTMTNSPRYPALAMTGQRLPNPVSAKRETVVFANSNARSPLRSEHARNRIQDQLTQMEAAAEREIACDRTIFGVCQCCNDAVTSEADACQAMGQLYHATCFVCVTCGRSLRGKAFFAVGNNIYCEEDYLYCGFQQASEQCAVCSHPITDMILQAVGKSFHPVCFRCISCRKALDGVPFTVDADAKVYCVSCYHKVFAPICHLCKQPITPISFDQCRRKQFGPFAIMFLHCLTKSTNPELNKTRQFGWKGREGIPELRYDKGLKEFGAGPKISAHAQGMDETVRVVSMKKDFHVDCYICEGCGIQLTDEPERRCYPLGNHLLCQTCHLHWARTGGSEQPITDL